MKENLLLFLLHHATKRSGGDVWLMWGRGAMFRGQWVGLAKKKSFDMDNSDGKRSLKRQKSPETTTDT